MTRLIILIAALVVCSACGQSGPLYIPGNPSQVQEPPPPPELPDDPEDEDDEDSG